MDTYPWEDRVRIYDEEGMTVGNYETEEFRILFGRVPKKGKVAKYRVETTFEGWHKN